MGKRKGTTNNLIVISDTHVGCKLGLLGPEGAVLDEGNVVLPSKFQKKMWGFWEEFWGEWVPRVTRGKPYDLVHNGDAIDGVHHNATTQFSHNIKDQIRAAEAILKPVVEQVKAKGGNYYHIRGTEAHVGKSAEYEEDLAKKLGAVPNEEGQYARYDLWKRVGGALVHLLHHIGTTSSAAHESSAVNAELSAMYNEGGRWGGEVPNYIVRSHRHRFISVTVPTVSGYASGIVTPAWQGKTPFAWKIPGARLSEPQIGGILIAQGDEEHYYRSYVKTFERSREE